MIKLTRQHTSGNEVLIRIDGSLSGETIGELRRFVESETRLLAFDLDGLTSLDSEGRAFLGLLREHGHQLRGGSLYIKRLLQETQS